MDDDDKIWTLEMNGDEKNKNVPIVLLHGFGAGLGKCSLPLLSFSTFL